MVIIFFTLRGFLKIRMVQDTMEAKTKEYLTMAGIAVVVVVVMFKVAKIREWLMAPPSV